EDNLLLVTEEGYAKRLPVSHLKRADRGNLGTQALKFATKTDHLAGMVQAIASAEVALVTNKERVVRIPVETVPILGRDGKGESILDLNRDERIITVMEVRM
ncbi:DNA gyrase C-terminal beta-propeller domain-containing protein, partial [Nodularia sphaerocarpa]